MTDKRGPTLAWLSAILVTLACLLIAAGAARAVHAQVPPSAAQSSGGQSSLAPGDHDLELTSGGHKRTFIVHVPTGYTQVTGTKPLPLVLVLHGAGGSGRQIKNQTGWDKKADKETFLAVFPDALPARLNAPVTQRQGPRFWRDGSGRGAVAGGAESASVDDVAFIGAVLDDVAKRFPVDEKRIFVTGFSSGASMTFRLVVSPQAVRFAAAAPVSGHLWLKDAPPPSHSVPLLLIWGTADPLNPIEGADKGPTPKPSLQAEIAAYAKAIGATTKPAPISDTKGVKRVAYGPGKNGAEFIVVTVEGAGHVWPGGKEILPQAIVGPRSDKINATEVIWEFLNRHFSAPRSTTP